MTLIVKIKRGRVAPSYPKNALSDLKNGLSSRHMEFSSPAILDSGSQISHLMADNAVSLRGPDRMATSWRPTKAKSINFGNICVCDM